MAVDEFFSAELGLPKHVGDDELRYNCPFCSNDDSYKLYLHVGGKLKNGKSLNGQWHCFKCGARGNPPSFVMQLFNIGFKDALAELEAYDYHHMETSWVSPESMGLTDEEYMVLAIQGKLTQEFSDVELTPPPLPYGYKRIVDNIHNPEVLPFVAYLVKRGFTSEDIATHNIGYVTNSQVDLPSGKKLQLTNHIVFITHDSNGKYQYWNTRAIGDSFVKSINAPSREHEYSKKTVIFNLNRAVTTDNIVICEGVPDALTIGVSGVATFGKQVTEQQIKLLTSSITENQRIYIMLDNDAKDQIAELADKLYRHHKETYIVLNPEGGDANDIGNLKAWELINNNSVKADANGLLSLLLTI